VTRRDVSNRLISWVSFVNAARRRRYRTDLSDTAWAFIARFISRPDPNPATSSSSSRAARSSNAPTVNQPLPPPRPPLRSHDRHTREIPHPQPNRPVTPTPRPQPVVRHPLDRTG
jgi:hypothetical protein